ncbi:ig-like domain-containing protein [Trichonephila inaurata madagascariensis]|uniref:Ig-like domain-containing protein n=1 Tax=Trichonephila inaurata madagascariensis TaxID=2747483 RepID=A0A8X7C3P5_9ARAC|nr:ig-like domain-containing protein [Trichonephila inaurata madagascariensis]
MITKIFLVVLISFVWAETGHPSFDQPIEFVLLQEGSLAKIECIAQGEKPLIYTWYNQIDNEITSDANNAVFSRRTEKGCSLIFDAVKSSHAGIYTCIAKNRHGSSSKTYDIAVNTTSGNITINETGTIDKVEVVNVTDESVEFSVEISGEYDSFYASYKDKLEKSETVKEFKKGERVLVTNLSAGGLYEFQFQIESPLKIKLPSKTFNVTLLPRLPDVIFRSLTNGLVEIEWFQTFNETFRGTIDHFELSYDRVQQYRGTYWTRSDCEVNIKLSPRCLGSKYTIAGLSAGSYYEIRFRSHTAAGYGKEYVNKIYSVSKQ